MTGEGAIDALKMLFMLFDALYLYQMPSVFCWCGQLRCWEGQSKPTWLLGTKCRRLGRMVACAGALKLAGIVLSFPKTGGKQKTENCQ